jgi:pyruvate dehydrogenase E2 component (dihydrolipoamide acetyltransferase)
MPKMSDHMEQGTVLRWLVKEGETVSRGQVLLEVETDKATGEIESPADGVLKGIRAGEGDTLPVGETIAFIARENETVPARPSLAGAPSAAPEPVPATVVVQTPAGDGPVPATPVARRLAKDLGVDLRLVKGTGPGGRVKDEDVRAYAAAQSEAAQAEAPAGLTTSTPAAVEAPAAEAVAAPAPTAAPAPAPAPLPTPAPASSSDALPEALPLTNIQQITGQRMLESVRQAPHFFLQVSANMANALQLVERARPQIEAETGARLSITALLVKVAAQALKKYPRANSTYDNGALRHYGVVNIGVAVGAEDGLAVPVIKNADKKPLAEIALELKSFQARASEMRFSMEDLSGGTFTISNLGMYGIEVFTAIINPPQSSILAVGSIVKTPVGADDGSISLQPLMALTLSVDHRCMDGLQGAKFLGEIKKLLEEPYLML